MNNWLHIILRRYTTHQDSVNSKKIWVQRILFVSAFCFIKNLACSELCFIKNLVTETVEEMRLPGFWHNLEIPVTWRDPKRNHLREALLQWHNPSHLAWLWRWRSNNFKNQRVALRGVYAWFVNSKVIKHSDCFDWNDMSECVARHCDNTSWQGANECLCAEWPLFLMDFSNKKNCPKIPEMLSLWLF